MRFRFQASCLATAVLSLVSAGSALADDNKAASSSTGEKGAEYGVGFRLRSVRAPKAMLELVVERAPDDINEVGYGIDLVRRRGSVELQLGFEYEHIQPAEGVWIQSNTDVAAGDEADYILGPEHNGGKSLRWYTIEFTFLNHASITKHVAIRYGGGAGIGIVKGELARYDVFCNGATNESPEPGCVPPDAPFNGSATYGGDTPGQIVPYNLPPVFPVVNAILGLQIRPFSKMTINIEGGIRTFPFFGASAGLFF